MLVPEIQPAVVLAPSTPAKEKRKAELKTKVPSSEPSSTRKSERGKKKWEPLTEPEEEEELIAAPGVPREARNQRMKKR